MVWNLPTGPPINDPETAQHWDRVTGKKCTTFKITEKDFTISNTDSDTVNNDIKELDTKANRHEGQSNQELALIVNSALIELLEKANKRRHGLRKCFKRISQHEKII